MPRRPSNVAQCVVCGRTGKLFLCAGCDGERYCSAMCQAMSFCSQGAKKHYFHHMYQARVAGLSPCFVYAARNGLIGRYSGVDMGPVVECWAKSIRKANKQRDAVDEEGYRFSASLIIRK